MAFDLNASPSPAFEVLDNNRSVYRAFRDNGSEFEFMIVRTNAGRVMFIHGQKDGSVAMDDETFLYVVRENKVDYISCCFPKQVSERFPQIKDKLLFSEWDEPTSRSCFVQGTNERNRVAKYIIFGTQVSHLQNLTLSQCTII